MKYSPTDIARQFLYVRESINAQNTGLRVEGIQRWCGGIAGQSWCAYFATMILDICFQGHAPIEREGSCETIYDIAKHNNWVVTDPLKDDIFIYVDENDFAHHIGIVTVDGGGMGIAGNTSQDGTSSNGTGVFEHSISTNPAKVKYIRYPK